MKSLEREMYDLCKELFPINRSLTGDGVRETLGIIKSHLPELKISEVPTGTKCFDWEVPQEWKIREAYIIDPEGKKIVDFKQNNLHIVGYSEPIDCVMSLEDLNTKLHSIPEQPDAIPYYTSYYKKDWGFCITDNQRKNLKQGDYKVFIDSEFFNGCMNYGEILIPGETEEEIFFSTYICHPSMANNELSGPVVNTFLGKHIQSIKSRRLSYRLIFVPETIGAIAYLSKNLAIMKKNIIAGYQLTCLGDNNNFSFMPSRDNNTLADMSARHVLRYLKIDYDEYSFLTRGSDERQYCYPGIDLPVCSIMRSKYGNYDEYHTSLDNMEFISEEGLKGAYDVYKMVIDSLEMNLIFKNNFLCEPQLGKRGLYPQLSNLDVGEDIKSTMNFLAYCDGETELLRVAEKIQCPIWELDKIASSLIEHEVISVSR
jgi:aminopeptidase-like protein